MQVRAIRELTIKDDTASCYNRRYFEEFILEEMSRANRFKTPMSLIFFDMDNLKDVNTRLGHAAGSRTLLEVSERVRGKIRKFDKLFRFGGDEFCIVLPETEWHGATEVAERVREVISGRPFLDATRGAAGRAADDRVVRDRVVPAPRAHQGRAGAARRPRHAVDQGHDEERHRHRRAAAGSRWIVTRAAGTSRASCGSRAAVLAIAGGVLVALLFGAFQLGRAVERWSAPRAVVARRPIRSGNVGAGRRRRDREADVLRHALGSGKEAEPSREAQASGHAAAARPAPRVTPDPGSSRSSSAAIARRPRRSSGRFGRKAIRSGSTAVARGLVGESVQGTRRRIRDQGGRRSGAEAASRRRPRRHLGGPRRQLSAAGRRESVRERRYAIFRQRLAWDRARS